jgi:Xaa-Pro aminopeptidase
MFSKDIYIQRRQKLKRDIGSGVILLLGNEETGMNYKDNCYRFRQDSSFLYFTGLDKPSLALVIDIDVDKEIMIGDEASIDDIVWMGTQLSLSELASKAGIEMVQPVSNLEAIMKKAIEAKRPIHFLPAYRPENSITLSYLLGISLKEVKDKASIPLIKAVVAQRSVKSPEEITEINKAVNASNEMHLAAMRITKEGLRESEVAGVIEGIAISAGGNISYPVIYTVNGQTLHNHATSNVMKKGQLVLCDAGAETAMHYAGDLTRTFPVEKKFTAAQKEVYEIVLGAEQAAVETLAPGKYFRDIHFLASNYLVEGLKQMGLMKGDSHEAVQQGAHALFFPCGLGHMMGLDVHDMEDLGEEYVGYTDELKKSRSFGLKSLRLGRALEPGFVLTVEPGIYFIPELIDRWQAENKFNEFINYDKLMPFRNFGGARVEENFLVTETGYRLLGDPLIKEISEIELVRTSANNK